MKEIFEIVVDLDNNTTTIKCKDTGKEVKVSLDSKLIDCISLAVE
jgi:hypothetical protein